MKNPSSGRHKGYVSGFVTTPKGEIPRVRVRDEGSPLDGRYFTVGSTHDNVTLQVGFNVDFLVTTVRGSNGENVPRAADVSLAPYINVNNVNEEK